MDETSDENAEGNLQNFSQKLHQYSMCELRMMYVYFREDLVYIVQILNTQSFLAELKSRTRLPNVEDYQSMKSQLGDSAFSEKLVQDVLGNGRDAVIGFWECLYIMQTSHPHHNLLAVLWEIQNVEMQTLQEQMIVDENGQVLDPDIKEIKEYHKEHLGKITQSIVECKPPGTTLESQSFSIVERYVNLVVASTEQFRCRTQHELVEIGEKHKSYLWKTHRRLERVSLKRLFCCCRQIKQVPNVIMISGVPGVGKTTLMQKFVNDWASGKLYQRFSFVLFFKFRDLNRLEGKLSLEDLICNQYPHLDMQLESILKVPEQLLFIFDGLDESCHAMDFASRLQVNNTKQKQELGVVLVNLWRRTLLKGCSVLITSRPAKLVSVDVDIFQLFCEVMGFFHEERKMYFTQFFDKEVLGLQAFNYVTDNEALSTFCYIPSYCWIICTVLSMCFQQANSEQSQLFLPKTMTQLFVTFISNLLANHSKETKREKAKELLLAMGWLAEYGVMNRVIVFEERHMRSFFEDKSFHLFTSFMVESKQSLYVNYSFLHLTVQEFLAALVHHIDYKPDKLQKALENAKSSRDGHAEIFLRFLFGLSDRSTNALLRRSSLIFPDEASQMIITWLRQYSQLVNKTSKDAWERKETLNIFNYLFESRNKELASEILGQNVTFDFSKFNLTPLDCTVLAFILKSCKESKCLDLEKCYLEPECWERLSPGLHTVQSLRLNLNELKDKDMYTIAKSLAHPDCKIQDLRLTNNELSDLCCSILACEIRRNLSLKSLDLTFNNLTGPRFRELIDALSSPACRVKRLVLCAVRLTHEDCQILVSLSNNTNLEHLNLSHNSFTDAGSGHIKELIKKSSSLKYIMVAANEFSSDVIQELKSLNNSRQDLKIKVW
ncbi:NACHT, LRR and PYD domains-containing protein 3-like [Mantella aurantiaca]